MAATDKSDSAQKTNALVATAKRIATNGWFETLVVSCIMIAAISSGIQTYESFAEEHEGVFDILDTAILFIFAAECVFKIIAECPKCQVYFHDPWNMFDFIIVLIGFIFKYFMEFPQAAILRIIRLLRVLKLVKAFPELQMLVTALLNSVPSMFYVLCLLMLLFYLFSVTAVVLFGDNDPIHFGTLEIALLSMWRITTFEDWTDIMYINMYGCNEYGYTKCPADAASCTGTTDALGSWAKCTDSSRMPVFAAIYFVIFTIFSTMIVVNLFVGVILNGVDEAQADQDEERQIQEKGLREALKMVAPEEFTEAELDRMDFKGLQKEITLKEEDMRGMLERDFDVLDAKNIPSDKVKTMIVEKAVEKITASEEAAKVGIDLSDIKPFPEDFTHKMIDQIIQDSAEAEEKLAKINAKLKAQYQEIYAQVKKEETFIEGIGRRAAVLESQWWFEAFVVGCIFVAAINSGLQTYGQWAEDNMKTLEDIDKRILDIFCLEMLIKIIARYPKPRQYLNDPWNVFDCVIVCIGYLFGYLIEFSMISIIRIIRLLRVLKLVKAFPELRVLVGAVLTSIPSMVYVMMLLFLLFYVFAVAGVTLLGENDPIHFGTVEVALLSLYRISTFEDWTDIMYINMYGCNNYGYDASDPGPIAACNPEKSKAGGAVTAICFVFFTFMATLIILNLFVGVILGGVEKAQNEEAEKSLEQQLLAIGEHTKQLQEALVQILPQEPGQGGEDGRKAEEAGL